MSVDSSGSGEDDKPIFRPLTRDSLAQIQARIDSEHAKKKELDRKRAEGEVSKKIPCKHVCQKSVLRSNYLCLKVLCLYEIIG